MEMYFQYHIVQNVLVNCCDKKIISIYIFDIFLGIKDKKEDNMNNEILDSCETSDILLWAIFANRKEIAEICWIRGEDHLGMFQSSCI